MKDFSTAIRVAVIKRATRDFIVYCEGEGCGEPTRDFQIDHIIPRAQGGPSTLENAQLLGKCCYSVKNPADTKAAAKTKRIEAKHLGADRPKQKIKSRGFRKSPKVDKLPVPPPRQLFK
jgi:5-methylcytosine-specific restriction endonuclease McrA